MKVVSGRILILLLKLVLCRADHAALSVSWQPTSQHQQVLQDLNYCVVYNTDYTSIPTAKQPDNDSFHSIYFPNSSETFDHFGCSEMPGDFESGQALIVNRGNCTFYQKAIVAQSVNASMLVVVYNESLVQDVPNLSGNSSTAVVTIPVLMLDNVSGLHLMDLLNSSPVYLSAYIPKGPPIDPSVVLIFCIAVTTVLLASFLANTPLKFLRYGLLHHKGNTHPATSDPKEDEGKGKKTVVLVTLICIIVMVAMTCTLLLLLYYFYYPMVYITLGLYSLAAVLGLYNLLSPFVALIPLGDRWRLPKNKIPILSYQPNPLFFITLLFSIVVVVWWVVERHASYAWLLQDILGFAFIAMLLTRLRFLKVWIIAVLMVVLFFYDIFMVFITPYFTKDGVSVMEKAATGPNGFSSSEQLPVVFIVPRLIYPTKLESICEAYITGGRPHSLLGYGDVGIPGLLITLCLKFDLQSRAEKCFRLYYATSGIAYTIGLLITFFFLWLTQSAQPALLYLVPTTLGSVLVLSLLRKEFRFFFTGKLRVRSIGVTTSQEAINSRTCDSEPDTEAEGGDHNDNEKQALIHEER